LSAARALPGANIGADSDSAAVPALALRNVRRLSGRRGCFVPPVLLILLVLSGSVPMPAARASPAANKKAAA
jgi:hypothetical protein